MEWVNSGGYLMLVPEGPGTPDPVVDVFDLVWTDSLRESRTRTTRPGTRNGTDRRSLRSDPWSYPAPRDRWPSRFKMV